MHVHPLFWAVACIAIVTGYFWELITLLLIVMIHELAHASVARYFQWNIKRVIILPFGGVCEVEEHGNRPIKEEVMIVIAGPLQHLWLAGLFILLEMLTIVSTDYAQLFLQFNAMVFLFNLLPIWPLDGGKLVHLFLASRQPFLKAMQKSLLSSFILLAIVHLFILFYSPLHLHLWLVLFYLYVSLWLEWKQLRYTFMRFLLERHYGRKSEVKQLDPLEVCDDQFLYEVMERFHRGCKHLIHVISEQTSIGKLDENELLHAYFTEKQVQARLKDIVYND